MGTREPASSSSSSTSSSSLVAQAAAVAASLELEKEAHGGVGEGVGVGGDSSCRTGPWWTPPPNSSCRGTVGNPPWSRPPPPNNSYCLDVGRCRRMIHGLSVDFDEPCSRTGHNQDGKEEETGPLPDATASRKTAPLIPVFFLLEDDVNDNNNAHPHGDHGHPPADGCLNGCENSNTADALMNRTFYLPPLFSPKASSHAPPLYRGPLSRPGASPQRRLHSVAGISSPVLRTPCHSSPARKTTLGPWVDRPGPLPLLPWTSGLEEDDKDYEKDRGELLPGALLDPKNDHDDDDDVVFMEVDLPLHHADRLRSTPNRIAQKDLHLLPASPYHRSPSDWPTCQPRSTSTSTTTRRLLPENKIPLTFKPCFLEKIEAARSFFEATSSP